MRARRDQSEPTKRGDGDAQRCTDSEELVLTNENHTRRWWLVLLMAGALAFLFGTALLAHVRLAGRVAVFNDDARAQIAPFYRYGDPALASGDYLGDYFLRRTPIGVRALYMAGARLWDAERLSKYLPYALLIMVLLTLEPAARRLGGSGAAFFALALGLSSGHYLHAMAGGLARAFGFPLVSATALALICGRIDLLALLACLGSAFYPSMAVVSGLALVLVLFILPAADRGQAAAWTLRWRTLICALTAGLAILIMLPSALSLRSYGRMLRPTDIIAYPEIGPGGRNEAENQPPFLPLTTALPAYVGAAFVGAGAPIFAPLRTWIEQPSAAGAAREHVLIVILVAVMLLGTGMLAVQDAAARRVLMLLPVIAVAYYAACQLYPYLYVPRRFLMYPVPILAAILFPSAAAALPRWLPRRWRHPLAAPLSMALICGGCLLALGSRGEKADGLDIVIQPRNGLYEFLATLPPDALIAGWPSGVINNVPYLSRRYAFLTREAHDVFFAGYADEMRRRMSAFIAAYYASDDGPLRALHEQFGVTHLIVNRQHYDRRPPHYFAPFARAVRVAQWRIRGTVPATLRHPEAEVFSQGPLVVLDLRRLGSDRGLPEP